MMLPSWQHSKLRCSIRRLVSAVKQIFTSVVHNEIMWSDISRCDEVDCSISSWYSCVSWSRKIVLVFHEVIEHVWSLLTEWVLQVSALRIPTSFKKIVPDLFFWFFCKLICHSAMQLSWRKPVNFLNRLWELSKHSASRYWMFPDCRSASTRQFKAHHFDVAILDVWYGPATILDIRIKFQICLCSYTC